MVIIFQINWWLNPWENKVNIIGEVFITFLFNYCILLSGSDIINVNIFIEIILNITKVLYFKNPLDKNTIK